jgi:hypothetical protein
MKVIKYNQYKIINHQKDQCHKNYYYQEYIMEIIIKAIINHKRTK